MKKYIIYHPQPGKQSRATTERKTFDEAKAEYKRLQGIYPSNRLSLYAVNDWGERGYIHSGYWE